MEEAPPHIRNSARQAFAAIFAQAVESHFSLGDCRAEVRPISTPSQPAQERRDVIMLTTASMRFRLTAVFRVLDAQAAQRGYLQARQAQEHPSMGDFVLKDQLHEMGNMACGELNRELLQYFANVALSSPSVLHTTAERLFKDMRCEHVAHFAIALGGQPVLDASLCMTAQAPVDFSFKPAATQVDTGELELL